MKRGIFTLALMLFTAIFLFNCNKNKKNDSDFFVGTWFLSKNVTVYMVDGEEVTDIFEYEYEDSPQILILNNDGTGKSIENGEENLGTWKYTDGKLMFDGDAYPVRIIDENNFSASIGKSLITFTLH